MYYMACLLSVLFFYPGTHILFSKIEKRDSARERLLGIVGHSKLKTIAALGNTAKISKGSYWPASTIKLLPAIAVMRSGINPKTYVRMKRYRGTVRTLLERSLTISSNVAYDSLVGLVGQDYVNTTAKQLGLKYTWVSKAYGRKGTFRYSPPYWLGRKYIRAKWAKLKNPKCSSNCTSFKDLQKMILYASKDKELRRWTRRRGRLAKVFKKYFPKAKIYCKPGFVSYHHGLTNCRIGDYIITIATPCGSWKNWYESKKLRIRMAEYVISTYLKRKK